MSNPMDVTAAELAERLEGVRHFPHNTAGLSMLEEATIAYGELSPELREAHYAFGLARYQHMRSYRTETGAYSDERWDDALSAGERLAALLQALGDFKVERCERQAGWGECRLPLRNGECRSTEHTD